MTHTTHHSPPSEELLWLVFSVGERVELLRRGADNGTLLQIVSLQESEEESG